MKELKYTLRSVSNISAYFFIFYLLILRLCLAGHIYPWDISMNYINAGFASLFTIPFKLESGISNSDYLKIVFPFKLHTQESYGTSNGDIPVNLSAQYSVA